MELKWFRWMLSLVAVVAVCVSTVTLSPRPSAASGLATDRARANQLLKQINADNAHVEFLGQKYDLARLRLDKIHNEITNTKSAVVIIKKMVTKGNNQLRQDAVFAYVTNGSAANNNPLFSPSASNMGATNVYNQLAEGNVSTTIANLKNYRIELTQQRSILAAEVGQAAHFARAAAKSFHSANVYQASLRHALSQVKGSIATFISQARAATAARDASTLSTASTSNTSSLGSNFPAPPPDSKANIAVGAALSYIGTWYSWGGASRSGVDCSGLVMLAYDAAGIYLPHYSGAQYNDTQRVPLRDIQPGDLLFYGYNGDEHVSMYIGAGQMIEAEMTGTRVHVVPVRLGYGFVGLGRPRA